MAIVIRHQFNNQNWVAPCRHPGNDQRCHECFTPNVAIKSPKWDDEICSGNCWERCLRNEFRWGCAPRGNVFSHRVNPSDDAFLVFRQVYSSPRLYTLWAVAKVKSTDNQLRTSDREDVDGFAFIEFQSFDPLPTGRWVRDLTAGDLVQNQWGQGNHRFVSEAQAAQLRSLIG